ncbi:hypothetical protein [Craterilacuibacter sp. RT1T]|uniref:hypothetical protein n=1 Tax=Craterilacuibacter sp. RT1T TaxID=2942211 RepID=UPI0020BDEEF5|nr:hypothetical protein [Craterilacuibacter sp. RT1T]MCL6261926.1 hypothetical protein [Craterilacuibacter sp. RT1T]
MKPFRMLLTLFASLLLMMSSIAYAYDIETRAVQFAKGKSSATINDTIKGDLTIDYTLRARAGQTMSVKLATKNGANYFNVLPPGSNDEALFVGSSSGNEWTGVLPDEGEYKVRVYLMRSAARRNEVANYTLTVGITGAAKAVDLGKAPASDAKVKGTRYHATGPLPCHMGNDKPIQCEFGVIRGKPGNAEVHITPPGGLKRVLTFMGDKVTTDPRDKLKAVKKGYDWEIEVNDYEHYTIPEAVVQGG